MNTIRNPRAAITVALATSLLLVAGGAFADDTVQSDRAASGQTNTDRLDNADSNQPVDDTWITTKIKASLLADNDVAGTDIQVETNNGAVALSGTVDSQAQADQAKQIARDTKGVVSVDASDLKAGR